MNSTNIYYSSAVFIFFPQEYTAKMKDALHFGNAESPMKATMESVLPGVQLQFTNIHRDVLHVRRALDMMSESSSSSNSSGITGTFGSCLFVLFNTTVN